LQEDGDALLIEGVARRIANPKKAPLALGVIAAVVTLASLGVAPIAHLAIAGAALMLLLRCLDVPDATRALDSSVLLLLAGTIPLGIAMDRTGIAHGVAVWVAELAGDHGAVAVVSAFYLLTSVLTEILSNNATAVLMTPIGLGIANELGIDPKPILVAIAFGGSASFATPIGYQTNTMVMGPGGYAFRDFLRFGLPMNLLLWIVATLMIPVFWPA
jgi:di/tricarboxylate transporter